MPKKKPPYALQTEKDISAESPVALYPLDGSHPIAPEKELKEYDKIIARVFSILHEANVDAQVLPFTLEEVKRVAAELELEQENPPDIAYVYRTGRSALPHSILAHGNWAITGAGKGRYEFIRLNRSPYVTIPQDLKITRILDSTPQIVLRYQGQDEQSILSGYAELS